MAPLNTPKLDCPVCGSDMRSRSLYFNYSLKPYRVCPDCGARYCSDPVSKNRLWLIILLAMLVMGLTIIARFNGSYWWGLVVLNHVALWGYLVYAVSKITYVKYDG